MNDPNEKRQQQEDLGLGDEEASNPYNEDDYEGDNDPGLGNDFDWAGGD